MKFRVTPEIRNARRPIKFFMVAGISKVNKRSKVVFKAEVSVEWKAEPQHFELSIEANGARQIVTQGIYSDTFFLKFWQAPDDATNGPELILALKKTPNGIDKANEYQVEIPVTQLAERMVTGERPNLAICRVR